MLVRRLGPMGGRLHRLALLLIAIAFGGVGALAAPKATSCSPEVWRGPPWAALANAQVVFRGRVTSGGTYRPLATYLSLVSKPGAEPVPVVEFEVDRYWKGGDLERRLVLLNGDHNPDYGFEVGREYLVYAYTKSGADQRTGMLAAHLCGGSQPVGEAGRHLRLLGPGVPPWRADGDGGAGLALGASGVALLLGGGLLLARWRRGVGRRRGGGYGE